MKNETLEEAAFNYSKNKINKNKSLLDFTKGAKWQAKRMYSEEDMRECVKYILRDLNSHNEVDKLVNFVWIDSFNKWFEQFKK